MQMFSEYSFVIDFCSCYMDIWTTSLNLFLSLFRFSGFENLHPLGCLSPCVLASIFHQEALSDVQQLQHFFLMVET